MAINDPKLIISGFYSLPGGMDSSVDPSLLEPGKAAFAVNCRFRGGFITHRPPFVKRPLDFGGNSVLETRATRGRFQVAGRYEPDNGDEYILAAIGGRIFRFNVVDNYSVQELTITQSILNTAPFTIPAVDATGPITLATTVGLSVNATVLFSGKNFAIAAITGPTTATLANIDGPPGSIVPTGTPLYFYDVNPATADRMWYKQFENYAAFQNNQNRPLIWDGANLRRSSPNAPAFEVPIGNIMEYAKNRLAVTLPDSRTFAIGDLAYSSSGVLPNGRDSVLKFTQNLFQNQGKFFTVPQTCGGIKSMTAIPVMDGALNQGPLMAGTPEICFSVNLPTDATTWADITNPIQTVCLQSNGPVSDRGTILINSDVWYRRYDGWGSLVLARRDFNTWANTPKSTEMDRVLPFDDISLLEFENGAFFGGREIKTTSPGRSPFGVYHRGLIALDMNRVSGLRDSLPPAYDGLWTGLNTLQIVHGTFKNVERCFAFSVNFEGKIELFEILKEGEFDDLDGEQIRITWPFETGVLGQANIKGGGPLDLKRLENAEIWIDELFGVGEIKVWFRPVGAACWTKWRDDIRVCATTSVCSDLPTGECQDTTQFRPQYRSRIGLGKPPDDCDRNMNRPTHTAEGWQLRIESKGHFRIRSVRALSRILDEPITEPTCITPQTSTSTVFFFNTDQSFTAECPEGQTGMPITIVVTANSYAVDRAAYTSDELAQAAADALALAAATAQAEEELVCVPE